MINCNDCKHLNVTEEEQLIYTHTPHVCLKHGWKVLHTNNRPKTFHKYIKPCRICDGSDWESRESEKNGKK